jgi:hypothetical protein
MIPVIEFADCTSEQIANRIEELMRGETLARRVVIGTVAGQTVVGKYEQVAGEAVEVEIDPVSQHLHRVPCSEIVTFGEYVPPLDRTDELRGQP